MFGDPGTRNSDCYKNKNRAINEILVGYNKRILIDLLTIDWKSKEH